MSDQPEMPWQLALILGVIGPLSIAALFLAVTGHFS